MFRPKKQKEFSHSSPTNCARVIISTHVTVLYCRKPDWVSTQREIFKIYMDKHKGIVFAKIFSITMNGSFPSALWGMLRYTSGYPYSSCLVVSLVLSGGQRRRRLPDRRKYAAALFHAHK
jgi:hypothetical protein